MDYCYKENLTGSWASNNNIVKFFLILIRCKRQANVSSFSAFPYSNLSPAFLPSFSTQSFFKTFSSSKIYFSIPIPTSLIFFNIYCFDFFTSSFLFFLQILLFFIFSSIFLPQSSSHLLFLFFLFFPSFPF